MKNLAPDIKRQRLLIEGFYSIDADENSIKNYFDGITDHLNLRMYGKPIIFSPGVIMVGLKIKVMMHLFH